MPTLVVGMSKTRKTTTCPRQAWAWRRGQLTTGPTSHEARIARFSGSLRSVPHHSAAGTPTYAGGFVRPGADGTAAADRRDRSRVARGRGYFAGRGGRRGSSLVY